MLQVIHPLKEKSPVSDSDLEEHYGHEMMTWQKRVDGVVETPLRPRIGLHRALADPLQSSWIWTQGWSVLRECLQRKRPAERGEDLDIFYRLMQKPPRVAEDTGEWSRSRETHINTECFLSVCVFICGWTFVIAVCGVRFLVQGFKKNGESSGVCVCVCVCVPPEWRHRLVEAGLVLCGPKHCRVMNDLMAGEVSSVLQPLRMHTVIYDPQKWFILVTQPTAVLIFCINRISLAFIYDDVR